MNLFIRFSSFFFLALIMASVSCNLPSLSFDGSGEFTIMQWTDLHFCETEENDDLSMELQAKLIEYINPDLVIITGDAISTFMYLIDPTDDFFEECWIKLTKIFRDSNIHYAYIFGYSENQIGDKKQEIIDLEKTHPKSLLADSILSSETNYYVPIRSNKYPDRYSAILWLFDSNGDCYNEDHSWPCIKDDQLEWFETEYNNLQDKFINDPVHLGFMHVALPEYLSMLSSEKIYGNNMESINCPLINSEFFDDVASDYGFRAIYAGNNHGNDFKGVYRGVELAYGRKTGYGGYQVDDLKRGARVIKLKEDASGIHLDDYIVDEENKIHSQKYASKSKIDQSVCTFSPDKVLEQVSISQKILALVLAFTFVGVFFAAIYIFWKKGYLGSIFKEKATNLELESLKANIEHENEDSHS